MREAMEEISTLHGGAADVEIEIAVAGGEALAAKTWNPRLGIVGGISILGTTGIVVPFSCSAWIHSIHRGIDVARAAGLRHVAGATGNVSEDAVRKRYGLPDIALLDMGDFAGGLLKYLRDHPVERLTIAGGFGKLTKLAQGSLDLHSSRSEVDLGFLAGLAGAATARADVSNAIRAARTAAEAQAIAAHAGVPLAEAMANAARRVAAESLAGAPVAVDILVVGRDGEILAESGHG